MQLIDLNNFFYDYLLTFRDGLHNPRQIASLCVNVHMVKLATNSSPIPIPAPKHRYLILTVPLLDAVDLELRQPLHTRRFRPTL